MRIQRRMNEQPVKTATVGVVGKIKIGERVDIGGGKTRPASLDYFRVDAPEQYARFFNDYYGEKPNKITVVFLSNDMGEVCRNFYELRDGEGKRLAYGDGNTFYFATKQGDGTVKDVVWNPATPQAWMNEAEKKSGGKWRERLIMRFAIPALPLLGVWEFSTHGGDTSIPNLVGTIDTVMDMAGRIAGIPFDLIVEKVKSDKAGSKSLYPVVKIIPNISPESAEIVKGLPMQLGAILTEKRIAELSMGEPHPGQSPIVETEFEELESTPKISVQQRAETEFKKFKLESVEDFTNAAKAITKMPEKQLQVLCAEMLGDAAQRMGFSFDKSKGCYS